MFAKRTKKQVALKDGDRDVLVTIRKLSAISLEKAADQRQMTAAKTASMFGPDMFRMLQDTAATRQPADQKTARYGRYDRKAVLVAGIESWTSDEKLPEALDELDEEAAEFLYRAIVDLSDPGDVHAEAADAAKD